MQHRNFEFWLPLQNHPVAQVDSSLCQRPLLWPVPSRLLETRVKGIRNAIYLVYMYRRLQTCIIEVPGLALGNFPG